MIRPILNKLYLFSGYIAAVFLVGIAVAIMTQIIGRMKGVTIDATEAAGLCLAAATFFGLAHTFGHGGHVRITVVIERLSGGTRRAVEIFNCLIASLAVCYLSWNVILLAVQSYEFHDVSPGLLAMPFWIPQAGMAFGVTMFAVALLDELFWVIGGRKPRYDHVDDPAQDDRPVA
ncbi:TRAP transporter small permease [Microvirga sp. M2]|uniref:TRAP transporter small permease n=1 Tax=Microvirga sp. M2 TaxID=3073270 RepID=UPI0039C19DC9